MHAGTQIKLSIFLDHVVCSMHRSCRNRIHLANIEYSVSDHHTCKLYQVIFNGVHCHCLLVTDRTGEHFHLVFSDLVKNRDFSSVPETSHDMGCMWCYIMGSLKIHFVAMNPTKNGSYVIFYKFLEKIYRVMEFLLLNHFKL